MGKYDKEVADAKKIIDEWVKGSKSYHDEFIVMKKNNLDWEKKYIQTARALLDAKKHLTDEKAKGQIENAIETGMENLTMFEREGKRVFDDHNKWAMEGPRKSFGWIAEKLKLGKPGEERYEGVRKELGPILEKVSTAIRDTEGVWNKDVKFAIENQKLKLKAIAKEFEKGGEARDAALEKQMVRAEAAFKDVTDKVIDGLGFFKDENDLTEVTKGKFEQKDPSIRKQKYEQYKNKLKLLPGSADMITKNLGRVEKSFPDGYVKGPGKAGFANVVKIKDDAFKTLTYYQKYYQSLVKEFDQRKWS